MNANLQTVTDLARHLAKLRGMTVKKAKQDVSAWLNDPAFPARTEDGWTVARFDAFVNKKAPTENPNGAAPATSATPPTKESDPAKFEHLLDTYEEWLFAGKDILAWQVKMLRDHRPWKFVSEKSKKIADAAQAADTTPKPADESPYYDANNKLKDCESQKQLAMRLAVHFQGRIGIDISEQMISKWKSGGLPQGTPLPPAKLGNRITTQLWAEWLEKYILPMYPVGSASGRAESSDAAIIAEARLAEARTKILNNKSAELEYNKQAGHFGPVEKFRLARRGALMVYDAYTRRIVEQEAPRSRSEWLKPRLTPEQLAEFQLVDQKLAQDSIDKIHAEFERLLAQEPERQVVKDASK